MRFRPLTVRAQLTILLVLVSGCATVLVGLLGYRMSRNAVRRYALATLDGSARSGSRSISDVVIHRQERLATFLEQVELSCGTSGLLNRVCARENLEEFVASEDALCAVFTPLRGKPLVAGQCDELPAESDTATATLFAAAKQPRYLVRRRDDRQGTAIAAEFDASALQQLVRASISGPSGTTYVVFPFDLQSNLCRTTPGDSGPVLRRVAPLPALPGACVVAQQDEREAVVPALLQRRVVLAVAASAILLGALLAYALSTVITRPIARLQSRARQLQQGEFDLPVPVSGPAEIRDFAEVFAAMARSLRASREELREHERREAATQMAAALAHEINNPLTSLTYATALVARDPTLRPELRQYVDMAMCDADRLVRITHQLLGLYRGGARLKRFSVADMLRSAVHEIEPTLRAQGIQLETKFGAASEIVGFEAELRHGFFNLLRNSARALSRGDRIVVRVGYAHSWRAANVEGVRILLADTGPGIASDRWPDLFDPFARPTVDRGGGLGLWVARTVIQKQGGWVRLRSSTMSPHRGTSIAAFLPAHPPQFD